MEKNLTTGSVFKNVVLFSLPLCPFRCRICSRIFFKRSMAWLTYLSSDSSRV